MQTFYYFFKKNYEKSCRIQKKVVLLHPLSITKIVGTMIFGSEAILSAEAKK